MEEKEVGKQVELELLSILVVVMVMMVMGRKMMMRRKMIMVVLAKLCFLEPLVHQTRVVLSLC